MDDRRLFCMWGMGQYAIRTFNIYGPDMLFVRYDARGWYWGKCPALQFRSLYGNRPTDHDLFYADWVSAAIAAERAQGVITTVSRA